ncbi:hypothetical protein ABPG77_001635 [Micractinium sp. CCAP 211/92]
MNSTSSTDDETGEGAPLQGVSSRTGWALSVEEVQRCSVHSLRSTTGWALPVALLYLADKVLAAAARLARISFPSALLGMAAIVAALLAARRWRPTAAEAVVAFFRPGVDWVAHQWLPTFYIPALVTLPLAVAPLSGAALARAAVVVCIGAPLVLCFAAGVAVLIRRCTQTQQGQQTWQVFSETETSLPPRPLKAVAYGQRRCAGLSALGRLSCPGARASPAGLLAAVSLVLAAVLPANTGPWTTFPFQLAVTVLGYLAGLAMPRRMQAVVHPLLVCGAAPNAGAALHGLLTGAGYWATLQGYLTKGLGPPGAYWGYGPGDLLFSFLGVIILCFGFKASAAVYEQWPILTRHGAEILGATGGSALFSMLTTAGMARLAGLPPGVVRAMVPRSVTMALALPIAAQLDAPQPITAAAVALTGIAGSALVLPLLNASRFRDPIARGLAAAAAAHGLGTAALAAKEPEALPYCALAYAACGVLASLLVALPPLRALLLAIAG